MAASASRRSGWVSLCLTLVARMLLGGIACLVVWAVLPAAFGLKPTVVMTGSMLPRLVPGDVVLSRPVPAEQLQLGQTLLYPDPDRPGHLRMHRWIDVTDDGLLITKGDANPAADSTPIARTTVVGVASLRVPFVGTPVVWATEGRTQPLAVTALALLTAVVAAFWFRAADEDDDEADTDDSDDSDDPDDDAAATAADTTDGSATWPRRLAHTGAALLVVLGLGATSATGADAATTRLTGDTASSASWAAGWFSCTKAVRGAGAYFSWPLSEASKTTAADVTGNGRTGDYDGTPVFGVAGPCAIDGTTGVTLNGLTERVDHGAATLAAGPAVTLQVWFRTTSTRGGVLMSVSNGAALTMAIAMTTAGTLTLGALTPGVTRVTSSATFRDNVWHLATGTLGSNGLVLHVDGAVVASSGTPTSASAVRGDPRVGYGDADDLGVGTYDYFQGSVAFGTLFRSALTTAAVTSQYQAGRPA